MSAIQALVVIGFLLMIVGAAVRSTHKVGAHIAGGLWILGGIGCWFLAVIVYAMMMRAGAV